MVCFKNNTTKTPFLKRILILKKDVYSFQMNSKTNPPFSLKKKIFNSNLP